MGCEKLLTVLRQLFNMVLGWSLLGEEFSALAGGPVGRGTVLHTGKVGDTYLGLQVQSPSGAYRRHVFFSLSLKISKTNPQESIFFKKKEFSNMY